MGMTARTALALLLAAAVPALCDEPEISGKNAQAADLASVRDRLMTSLFFRGEVADMMISSGDADKIIDVRGFETNAEERGALIGWIALNTEKAAEIYLNLKSGGKGMPASMESYRTSWKFNPQFLALVKNLNSAAGDKAVPDEALEEAESRLYDGYQAGTAAPVVGTGGAGAARGTPFFAYADYKLNKAGLERELDGAGAWLDAAKGPSGRGPRGLEDEYGGALAAYASFVVAASSVKGRDVLTEEESRALETGRASLRASLAALALRVRASQLAAAEELLKEEGGEPGASALRSAVAAARTRLEEAAGETVSGRRALTELSSLAISSEKDFASVYLRYSVYNGLLALKKRAAGAGYSCLYDYALSRWLAARFPEAGYARARAELFAGGPALDAALLRSGGGDIAGAIAGLGGRAEKLESAARSVRLASEANRRAQFFLWGILFRPVELNVSGAGGRAYFRPAFTFFDITAAGRKDQTLQ
jgi:hypothetical protein